MGSVSSPPGYLSLTFYCQDKILVNSNVKCSKFDRTMNAIKWLLGPLETISTPPGLGSAFVNHTKPWGTKNSISSRERVGVNLCCLLSEMYKIGWRAEGNSVFDYSKSRGSLLFRLSDQEVSSFPFGALVLFYNKIIVILPQTQREVNHYELNRGLGNISIKPLLLGYGLREEVPLFDDRLDKLHFSHSTRILNDFSRKYMVKILTFNSNYCHFFGSMNKESVSSEMFAVLNILKVLAQTAGLEIETSGSVWGDCPDILFLKQSSPPLYDFPWALTVMSGNGIRVQDSPFGSFNNCVRLVNAPRSVKDILDSEYQRLEEWKSQWTLWHPRNPDGRTVILSLFRRLAQEGWMIKTAVNHIYKNSFFIFVPIPPYHTFSPSSLSPVSMLSLTCVSYKKLQCVHLPHDSVDFENVRTLIDAVAPYAKRKNDSHQSTWSFEDGTFNYSSDTNVSIHMDIFIVLLIELHKCYGYRFFGTGNISGRFDANSDSRNVSQHTWFLIKSNRSSTGESAMPSAPPYDDGLPTYEEAIKMSSVVQE